MKVDVKRWGDPLPRLINVYLEEKPDKNATEWQGLPAQCIYRAIDSNSALTSTKVAKNIGQYGSWLLAQKSKVDEPGKQKGAEGDRKTRLLAYCNLVVQPNMNILMQCYPLKANHLVQLTENFDELALITVPVLFLSEMLMKMSADLVAPLYIILTEEREQLKLPLVAMAVSSYRSEVAQLSKQPKDLKNIPRIAVITFSEERAIANERIFDQSELHEKRKELNNLMYVNMHSRSSQATEQQMKVEQTPRKHRLVLDLEELKLGQPFQFELVYLFRNLVALELRDFNPDIIVVEDVLSVCKDLIELKALALVLRTIMEIANCRVIFVKGLGCDQAEASPQATPTKSKINLFKNNLFKQSSIIMQSLYQVVDTVNLERTYYETDLSEKFLASYSELTAKLAKADCNAKTPNRSQLTAQLKLNSEAFEEYKKFLLFSQKSTTQRTRFVNLRLKSRPEAVPVEVSDNQQFYVHYGPKQTLFFVFRKDCYEVYSDICKGKWEQVGYRRVPQELLGDYSVTDSTLIASQHFLYRMFGRKNEFYGTEVLKQGCNQLFRIRLNYDQHAPLEKRFDLEQMNVNHLKNPPEPRWSGTGFFVKLKSKEAGKPLSEKDQIHLLGGHLEANSEDAICRKVVAIEDDDPSTITEFGKISEDGLTALIKYRVRFRPQLYCLPFPPRDGESEIAVLSTNAPNYEYLQRQPFTLSRYHCDFSIRKSSFMRPYTYDNDTPVIEMEEQKKCMDRKAFDRVMMNVIVRSNQQVNRYESQGKSCVSVYDSQQSAFVTLQMVNSWNQPNSSETEELRVIITKDNEAQDRFETVVSFRAPKPPQKPAVPTPTQPKK